MKLAGIFIIVFCLATGWVQAGETVKQREEREAYQKQLQFRLNDINQKISQKKINPSDVREESRNEFTQLSGRIRDTQASVQKKMSELSAARGLDSDRLKAETNLMINELHALHGRMSSLSK